tara:strand:- start:128 stop:271 length:144 start_codon:yes stop_codon:yes gene_type:complete
MPGMMKKKVAMMKRGGNAAKKKKVAMMKRGGKAAMKKKKMNRGKKKK